MPTKKLIELDGEYGGWLEIDPIKLRRVSVEFKNWLLKDNHSPEDSEFFQKDLLIVEAVLNGKLTLPYRDHPHSWEMREGLLPSDYRRASAPFYNTIAGSLYSPPEVIVKDGRYFAWAEWEDPPEDRSLAT
ncbi:MAG: hypothetical protein K2X75_01475 [Burkholderiaceae bacterium]|jgi:hypothetical protein|nr:hypothetical protein [Burkholderiaceae bacterium]